MGEAKRRKAEQGALIEAADRVSSALRRIAQAASGSFGGDCFMHAEFGRQLMADYGFTCVRRSGYAAWRVGPGDGDVIGHSKEEQNYAPVGVPSLIFHTWLEISDYILDFTTYQLRFKAASLDLLDGQKTTVNWCPDYLLIKRSSVQSHMEVAQAAKPPAVYYEANEDLDELVAQNHILDEDDLAKLRFLCSNQEVMVMGPNTFGLGPDNL